MHPLVAERMVERVRQRVSQGDCPTEPPLSVEKLENLVLTLADSLVRSNGWQDIASAPKDTLVLAWCPKHRLVLLERHSGRETETWAVSPSGRMDCPDPTHWQPLPAPPLDRLRGSEDDYCGIVVTPEDEPNV